MNAETIEPAAIAHRTIALPPIGTFLPHLGGTFWAVQRGKPGTQQADYAIIVPHGPQFEVQGPWSDSNIDVPGAACKWDGHANTAAMLAIGSPAAKFGVELEVAGFRDLYLPALWEMKALAAAGCDAFDPDVWCWTSTQFSRNYAFGQGFDDGDTGNGDKPWSGGRARFVRRSSLESLIS